MSIAAATRLGPYEIIAPVGAGGMGEVYRARDTRLGRDVAVKVLPSSYADNKERLQRFEQEACAAGALNHPNILSIHDIGWVAYASNESGPYQVYVQSFPTSGGKWQVSTDGGAQPQWRRDGKELFYLAPDRKLMAVEVNGAGPTFVPGVPQPLFEARFITLFPGPTGATYYAVTGDGQRFLVNTLAEQSTPVPFTVVLNWTAGLKR